MRFGLLWIVFFLVSGMGVSQKIVPVTGKDFPDATVSRPENYDGESLWGYIDGGADIYLEFGFKSLMVQEINWEDGKIKIEVYRMGASEGAFGIYSLSVTKCLQRDSLNQFDCNSKFQYQTAYGNLYISVTSENGSDVTRQHYLPVAKFIMQKNPQKTIEPIPPFDQPKMKKARKSLVYIQGPLGFQNSIYPWEDLFEGVQFGMYAITLPDHQSDIYFARIRFETQADLSRFLGLAGFIQNNMPVQNIITNDGLYREYNQIDPSTVYFLQSQVPESVDALLNGKD